MKKLDVVANEIFINCLSSSGVVSIMVSEENENIIKVEAPFLGGKYKVVFDPLDGSSNIDSGITIGTIFGIYDESNEVLSPGSSLISAGYALYGSFTALVLAVGNDVNCYTLDPVSFSLFIFIGKNLGEFILTTPNVYILGS